MPIIKFDMSRKSEILEAHRVWTNELPRQVGQLGGTITTWVEGPPSGREANFTVNREFVEFLTVRYSDIPFKVEQKGAPASG